MFDKDMPKMNKDMRSTLVDFLTEITLNDPDAPENLRASIKMVSAAKHFSAKLYDFVHAESLKVVECDEKNLIDKANEITEYIGLMSAGLDSFIEVWKHE